MGTVSLCGRNESTHQTMIPNFPHFCTQFLPSLSASLPPRGIFVGRGRDGDPQTMWSFIGGMGFP